MSFAPALVLREGDRDRLDELARLPSVPSGLAKRARMMLLAADGMPNAQIARTVGVSRPTVIGWRDRYGERGLAGLDDEVRSGRPRTVDHRGIVAATLTPSPKKYRGDALVVAAAGAASGDRGTPRWPGRGASSGCSHGGRSRFGSPPIPNWWPRSPTWSGCTWRHQRWAGRAQPDSRGARLGKFVRHTRTTPM